MLSLLLFFFANDTYKSTAEQISKPLQTELFLSEYSMNETFYIEQASGTEKNIFYICENLGTKAAQQKNIIELDTETKKIKSLTINGEILIKEYDKLFEEMDNGKDISKIEFKKDKNGFPMISYMEDDQLKQITYKDNKVILK